MIGGMGMGEAAIVRWASRRPIPWAWKRRPRGSSSSRAIASFEVDSWAFALTLDRSAIFQERRCASRRLLDAEVLRRGS